MTDRRHSFSSSAPRVALLAALGVATLALGACTHGQMVGHNQYTLGNSKTETNNSIAISSNTEMRMLTEDLARSFYWDRPSRLSNKPIPY